VPNLEVLELEPGFTHVDRSQWPLKAFADAPKLHTLCIKRRITISNLDVPWAQLTHLTFTTGHANAILDALTLCTNLISFETSLLGMQNNQGTSHIIHLSVFHPQLCQFQLFADILPNHLLDLITLPHLVDLDYTDDIGMDGVDEPSRSCIVSLIQHSNYELQRLCLDFHGTSLSEADVIACLSLTPALTMLVLPSPLSVASMTPPYLLQLNFNPIYYSERPLIPHLQVLKLDYHESLNLHLFVKLVESRRSSTLVIPEGMQKIERIDLLGDMVKQLEREPMLHLWQLGCDSLELFVSDDYNLRGIPDLLELFE
jgi:hypothetical protein